MKKIRQLIDRFFNRYNRQTREMLVAFASSAILYLAALYIYSHNGYYIGFVGKSDISLLNVPSSIRPILSTFFDIIGRNTGDFLWRLYFAYLIWGILKIIFRQEVNLKTHRSYVFWQTIWKFLKNNSGFITGKNVRQFSNDYSDFEKINMRYYLVKFFYMPIMLNFFYGNLGSLFYYYSAYRKNGLNKDILYQNGYLAILYLIFLFDTAIFVLGYAFEFKNKSYVRSVEPTILGWTVALMCYPPFNDLTGKYFGWGSADYSAFSTRGITLFAIGISILLYLIYVWASFALGLKASNLTNRGIVTCGPYKYIRHPAYISKNLAWIIMGIPLIHFGISGYQWQLFGGYTFQFNFISLNWLPLVAMFSWLTIYYLRALTEERHLLKDPDYQKYCQKVRYRFIPKVY